MSGIDFDSWRHFSKTFRCCESPARYLFLKILLTNTVKLSSSVIGERLARVQLDPVSKNIFLSGVGVVVKYSSKDSDLFSKPCLTNGRQAGAILSWRRLSGQSLALGKLGTTWGIKFWSKWIAHKSSVRDLNPRCKSAVAREDFPDPDWPRKAKAFPFLATTLAWTARRFLWWNKAAIPEPKR